MVSGGGWSARLAANGMTATVSDYDPATMSVGIDRPWPAAVAGLSAFRDGPTPASFPIAAVTGTRVRLRYTPLVYRAPVERVAGRVVTGELPLTIKQTDPVWYDGAWATNGQGAAWWRVTATPREAAVLAQYPDGTVPTDVARRLDRQIELDRPATAGDFASPDRRQVILLYQLGPGALLRVPGALTIRATPDGLAGHGTNAFTLTGPQGAVTVQQDDHAH
jgi:hypothetical protein